MKRAALVISLSCWAVVCPLLAREPFSLSGKSATTSAAAAGSSFPDIFESGLRAEGAFRTLDGQTALYSLRYADIENAMSFSINGAGTEAEFVIPITGFSRTFQGTDRDDLEDQLVDFLKNEGADVYRDFMEAIDQMSAVAVTDGNPSAATATIATSVFMENAFDAGNDEWDPKNAGGENGARLIGAYPEFSVLSAAGFDGTSWGYEVPLPRGQFGESRVGYKFSMPLRYRDIEGAKSGSAGLSMSFPVQIKKPVYQEERIEDGAGDRKIYRPRTNGLIWRMTPSVSGVGAGSADFAAGSLLTAGALSSSAEYKFSDKFRATLGNQFTMIEGVSDLSVQGYDVGSEVSQQMTKTGVHLAWSPRVSHTLAAYTIFSAFLQDAAIPEFFTFGFEYSYLPSVLKEEGLNPVLTLRGYADVADEKDYEAYGIRVGAGFVF